jgi:putative toxin-antitoxin system antitoxin component (TIGR02293 family)
MEEFMMIAAKRGHNPASAKSGYAVAEAMQSYVSNPRAAKPPASTASTARSGPRQEPALFAELVSSSASGGSAAVEAIRAGFPASMLKSASRYFGITDARMQAIVRLPASTAARLEKKAAKMDAAASERLYRMGMVTRMAIELFGDAAMAVAWMREANHALGDVAPLDLMDTEPGAASVRQALNAIATGGPA